MARRDYATAEYYAADRTYGNLAYETGGYAQPETLENGTVATEPRRQSQVKLKTEAAAARISPAKTVLYVLGFAIAAALLVMVLLEYVQLTAISDETGSLRSELAELQTERSRLLIDYESTFNLTEIEEYARNELGMVSVSGSQRHYLDTDLEDKAVVLKDPETEEGFLGSAKQFLHSILEYFR